MDWGVRMKNAELDWYTDYLLSSFGSATATGLSQMVQGAVSHDKVTRFLSGRDYTSKDLWMQVKGHPFQGVWKISRISPLLDINRPEVANDCTKNKQVDGEFTGSWTLM